MLGVRDDEHLESHGNFTNAHTDDTTIIMQERTGEKEHSFALPAGQTSSKDLSMHKIRLISLVPRARR